MMLKNYLNVTIRSLFKHWIYAAICVLGLAIGLSIALMAVSYVVRELSWEDRHVNKEQIYRVEMRYNHADTTWSSARVMAPLGEALGREIPGIEQVAVFRHYDDVKLQIEQKTYRAGDLIFARPEFLDVFTFPIKTGNRSTALESPYTVFVRDSIAQVYFPDQDPIGKTIVLEEEYELEIAGILEEASPLSQLQCDFLASYSTLEASGKDVESWHPGRSDLTYLLLAETTEPSEVENQVGAVFSRHVDADVSGRYAFSMQPLEDIYFNTYYSGNRGEIWPGFEWDVLIIVIGVAIFILIQAMVNFISLSTARGLDRMKEVGVRKTFGAARSQLMARFLGESMLLTFTALLIGLSLFEFFRRGYRTITPDPFELPGLYDDPLTIGLTILLTAVVGLAAGYYPALYLSRFKPISILRDGGGSGTSRSWFRRALVVFQFALAIFFIIETVGHYKQLDYLSNYDLGFEHDNMMILKFPGNDGAADCALARNEIPSRTSVIKAARTEAVMGDRIGSELYFPTPERRESDYKVAKEYVVDHDFFDIYGIEIVQGRGFAPDRPEEVNNAAVINESMVKELGLTHAVGHKFYTESGMLEVIGVVKDFHGTSLDWSYRANGVIRLRPDSCTVLALKLPPDDISGSIASIRGVWERILPNREFDFSFLDDEIRARYYELDSIMTFFGTLSVISILIACLGTFGLVLYTVERKTRDIAIRKVLGASAHSILRNLTRELVYLILVANVVAAPFAYLMMKYTFEYYPIQADFGFETYLGGGILTIVIALLTASYHVMRAARANPVDSLRYE